jgi:arylsulfatase A-like enzyme
VNFIFIEVLLVRSSVSSPCQISVRSVLRWFVIFALALLSWACTHDRAASTSLTGYNLVVINIDTLRADHLGCYGYGRNTSPFIDSLAGRGVLFERALSNSSYTRESVAVLFSGHLPSASGSVGWNARPSDTTRNLAERFRDAGYRTGFFSNTTMLTDPLFTKGFDEAQQLTTVWGLSGAGPKLSARALDFVTRHAGERFLLYLHYLDPHGPYDPPAELYRRFAPVPFAHPVNVYKDVRPNCPALMRDGFGPGDARFEDMVIRYDAEIADTDRSIEMLFHGLEPLHVLGRTLVVVTADHGEEFLEHGFVEHAWTLYDEALHVPLILWAPNALAPQRLSAPVSVVDVLPTLLQLLELPHATQEFDGVPLLERRGTAVLFHAPAAPSVAEVLIGERNVLRALSDGPWKYIGAQRWLTPEERPAAIKRQEQTAKEGGMPDVWGPITHEELYNLQDDPHEAHDRSASAPAQRTRLRDALAAYVAQCRERQRPHGATQPTLSQTDVERLRALGYLPEKP